MSDWKEYKERIRRESPEIAKDFAEVEEISSIVGAMIEQRHILNCLKENLLNFAEYRTLQLHVLSQARLCLTSLRY